MLPQSLDLLQSTLGSLKMYNLELSNKYVEVISQKDEYSASKSKNIYRVLFFLFVVGDKNVVICPPIEGLSWLLQPLKIQQHDRSLNHPKIYFLLFGAHEPYQGSESIF